MSAEQDTPYQEIRCLSGFGATTRKGFCTMVVGEHMVSLSPQEARNVAANLLHCADAAESDQFIFEFFTARIGLDAPRAAAVIREFRTAREQWQAEGMGGGGTT